VRRIRFLAEARQDLREAVLWYAQRDPEVAATFARAVERAAAVIGDAPERWPLKNGTRRYVVGRFPYTIAFHVDEATIWIVAVAHHRRDPGAWSPRR
jgi:plasmid stabilization system protein ParE